VIYVTRPGRPPDRLVDDGATELAAWRHHLAHGGRKPSFKAYTRAPVRAALMKLFHGKCAYCESAMGHVTPADVEHWRPKGKIRIDDGTLIDGYWWLAADWENVFAACPHCNRPTRHDVPGGSRTAGKGMRFPLVTPHVNAPREGDERTERPLLLNPCDSDPAGRPEQHLVFATELELAGVVQATADDTGCDDLVGRTSIDVYALNRSALVTRRAEKLNAIRTAITTVENAITTLQRLASFPRDDPAVVAQFDTITAQRALFDAWLAEDAEYLLLARQIVLPFLDQLARELAE
jgi:uncharacterized protein (TIGR02646 family)